MDAPLSYNGRPHRGGGVLVKCEQEKGPVKNLADVHNWYLFAGMLTRTRTPKDKDLTPKDKDRTPKDQDKNLKYVLRSP